METILNRWYAREWEWICEKSRRKKKELILTLVAVPAAAAVLPFVTTLFSDASKLSSAAHLVKYTLLWGLGLDLLLAACLLPQMPSRQYKKQLKVWLEKGFSSSSEREEMAAQMMGERGADSVICIPWKESGMGDQRIWVTKDYLLSTRGNGHLDLVFLDQVQQVEIDRKDITYKAGSSSARVYVQDEMFTITFQYREDPALAPEVKKFRGSDMKLCYPSRELRDQVLAAVQKLRPEESIEA